MEINCYYFPSFALKINNINNIKQKKKSVRSTNGIGIFPNFQTKFSIGDDMYYVAVYNNLYRTWLTSRR